jgi:hypothetical protein
MLMSIVPRPVVARTIRAVGGAVRELLTDRAAYPRI